MSLTEITVEGTLNPDGTLELDQKPNLPAGRVTIILRQQTEAATQEGWWPYMQRVRAEREAAGYHFLNEVEMEAHIQWLREDEDRIDRIYREMDLEKCRQENR
ncbi:MAG TPA: hypothetical protein VMF69_25495 [Gemmataceae bacterium]|nr:hypothetical protein [Gemmataceae bacterium]